MFSVEIREEVVGSNTRYQIYCDGVAQERLWAANFRKAVFKAFREYGCHPHGPELLMSLTKKRLLEIAEEMGDDLVHSGLSKKDIADELARNNFGWLVSELDVEDLVGIITNLEFDIMGDEDEVRDQLCLYLLGDVCPFEEEDEELDDDSDDVFGDPVSSPCEWISRSEQMKHLPGLIDEATSEVIVIAYLFPKDIKKEFIHSLNSAEAKDIDVQLYVDGRVGGFGKGLQNRKFVESNFDYIPVTYIANHAKAVVIDGKTVMLGSSNFNGDEAIFDTNMLVTDEQLAETIILKLKSRKKLPVPSLPKKRKNR